MTNTRREIMIDRACNYIIAKAYPKYDKLTCGKCARAVRSAFDFAFGKEMPRTESAKDYGPLYEDLGFKKTFNYPEQDKSLYKPKIGDLCIIQYEPHGHICLFTRKGWVSDYIQIDHYGGSIRKKNPPFSIYQL